jgi:hypothetical protein
MGVDGPSNAIGQEKVTITNRQLITGSIVIIAFISAIFSLNSTWVNLEVEYSENRNEGVAELHMSMEDSLGERNSTIHTYYKSADESSMEYDSYEVNENNEDMALDYQGTVDTKTRTKNLVQASLGLFIFGMLLTGASFELVRFESENIPFVPLLIAGILMLVSSAQFTWTYSPFDGPISHSADEDSLFCAGESEANQSLLLWNEWHLLDCNMGDNPFGESDFSFSGKTSAGNGFYSATLSGFMLVALFFRLLKKKQEIIVLNSTKSMTKEHPWVARQSKEVVTEPDSPSRKIKFKTKSLTKILTFLLVTLFLLCSTYVLIDVIQRMNQDYGVLDHPDQVGGSGSENLVLIENFGEHVAFSDLGIWIVSSDDQLYYCDSANLWSSSCHIRSADGGSVEDGWSNGEKWTLQEGNVDFCVEDECSINVIIEVDGDALNGPKTITIY